MACEIRSAAVYAEELASKGRGTPLWYPEPSERGEVEIGDVGFLYNGGFHRLFNVTVDSDHPFNANGVPEGFEPLPSNKSRFSDRRSEDIPPGIISSSSIGCINLEGKFSGYVLSRVLQETAFLYITSDKREALPVQG